MLKKEKSIIFFLVISICLHVFIFNFSKKTKKTWPDYQSETVNNPSKTIKIKKINKNDLKKFKKLGIKNGNMDFSTPFNTNKSKKLSLKSLATTENSQKNSKGLHSLNNNNFKVQFQKNKFKSYSNFVPSQANLELLDRSQMDLVFDPPKGVSKNELNTLEKIFYGFQKRTYELYVNSFLKNYNEVILEKPYLKNEILYENHSLTGRITFDHIGNIVSIKILKWSNQDHVQSLFENTLKSMNSIKNPPKSLVQNGNFSIYYKLKIHGKL